MHMNHVVHCDVKMDNVLVMISDERQDSTNSESIEDCDRIRAILSDFDVSLDCQQRTMTCTWGNTAGGFTFVYAAPEVRDGGLSSYASDLWSFGCLLSLATFPDEDIEFLDDGENFSYVPPHDTYDSRGGIGELLMALFARNPADRPTAAEALNHPYFENATVELRKRSALRAQLQEFSADHERLEQHAASVDSAVAQYNVRQERVVGNLRALGHLWEALAEKRRWLAFCDLRGQREVAEQQQHIESSNADIGKDLKSLAAAADAAKEQFVNCGRMIPIKEDELLQTIDIYMEKQQRPPMYWNWVKSRRGQQLVDVTEALSQRMQALLDGSSQDKAFEVQKVERVEDEGVWESYTRQRARVKMWCEAFASPAAPVAEGRLEKDPWVEEELQLDPAVNEKPLWHGVSSRWAAARMCAGDGYRSAVSGKFGTGLYFTDAAEVADACSGEAKDGTRCVVLARVCLGRCYKATAPMPDYWFAPREPQGADDGTCAAPQYDSVCGEEGKGRIFVIWQGSLSYPEMIVTYRLKQSPAPADPSPQTPARGSGDGKNRSQEEPHLVQGTPELKGPS